MAIFGLLFPIFGATREHPKNHEFSTWAEIDPEGVTSDILAPISGKFGHFLRSALAGRPVCTLQIHTLLVFSLRACKRRANAHTLGVTPQNNSTTATNTF